MYIKLTKIGLDALLYTDIFPFRLSFMGDFEPVDSLCVIKCLLILGGFGLLNKVTVISC